MDLTIDGIEHKISLFENDVMLILSNPKTSLAETQKQLEEFSAVSYYKINASRSQILDINIPTPLKSSLSKYCNFPLFGPPLL